MRVPSLLKLLVKEVSFKLLHNIFSYSTSIISSNSPCLHVFFFSGLEPILHLPALQHYSLEL